MNDLGSRRNIGWIHFGCLLRALDTGLVIELFQPVCSFGGGVRKLGSITIESTYADGSDLSGREERTKIAFRTVERTRAHCQVIRTRVQAFGRSECVLCVLSSIKRSSLYWIRQQCLCVLCI